MLNERDWIILNDMIHEVYAAEEPLALQTVTLKMLKEVILCFCMAFFLRTGDAQSPRLCSPVGINISQDALEGYIQQERMEPCRHLFKYPKCRAFRTIDDIDNASDQTRLFYQQLDRNICYATAVILEDKGVFLGMLNLYRSGQMPDFDGRDAYILDILKDHLSLRLFQLQTRASHTRFSDIRFHDLATTCRLTAREAEILGLVAKGARNEEICRELFVSSNTLSTHISSIYRKLGVQNRAAALRLLWGEY